MQIKFIKLLSCLIPALFITNAFGDLFYKFSLDPDGQEIRQRDLKVNPEFKRSKFITKICDGKNVSGAKTYCLKLFKDVQVHNMAQAIQIAKDYANIVNHDNITCYDQYYGCELAGCDDHIYCSTTPDKNAYYEFVFDDIKETSDSNYKQGIGKSYCRIFLGEDVKIDNAYGTNSSNKMSFNDAMNCYSNSKKGDDAYNSCVEMGNTLEKNFSSYHVKDASEYNCKITFGTLENCSYLANGFTNISSTAFSSMQTALNQSLVLWLGSYVQRKSGKEIQEFKCDLAPKTCHTGSMMNPDDDILRCYADGTTIDFLFDDLSESKQKWREGAEDAKRCFDTDGIYDGRRCQGISQEVCTFLRTKSDKNPNPIETVWDEKLDSCTLSAANTVANLQRAGEIMSTTGLAVGIAATTVATGGGTTMVLLAVGGAATSATSQAITSIERNIVAEFRSKMLKCNTRDCVREQMLWFIDRGSNYINNLTDTEINAVDEVVALKMPLLAKDDDDTADLINEFNKSKNKEWWERCQGDVLQTTKCISDAASIVLDALPVSRMALKAPEALGAFASKIGPKMPKTAKSLVKLRTESKVIRNVLKGADKIDTINDISTVSTGTGVM